MKTDSQRLFFDAVQNDFAVLLANGVFDDPYPRLDAKTGIFSVVFMGTHLAVELILNERDADISCNVSRMIDGQPALDYAVDRHGKLVRASLSQLLRARGIRDKLFTRVTGLLLEDQIPITLGDYARMLQAHAQLVIDDNPQFLEVGRV